MKETKGAMITGTNLSDYNIGVNAFLHQTTSLYINDKLEYGDNTHSYQPDGYTTAGHWVPVENHTYYWPKATNLDFWAWAPFDKIQSAIGATAENAAKITFADNVSSLVTTGAGPISFTYDLGVGTDANNLPDLMFSALVDMNQDKVQDAQITGHTTGCVPLAFKHALAAVQFKVKSTKAGKVTDIQLIDVTKKGTCTFSVSADNTTTVAWTTTTETGTYGHNFNTDLPANTYSDFYSTTGGHQEATFMMIPQTLGTTRKISIKIATDAGYSPIEYVGTIPNSVITAWEAGKTYVYTINIDDDVRVEVSDTMTPNSDGTVTKSAITTTNTGGATAYLRAAVSASWCADTDGMVIGPYTGTLPTTLGTNWVKIGDYYYYTQPVKAGAATNNAIFASFTSPTDKPLPGTHLEMQILLQGVKYDVNKERVTAAWGSDIASELGTTPETPAN